MFPGHLPALPLPLWPFLLSPFAVLPFSPLNTGLPRASSDLFLFFSSSFFSSFSAFLQSYFPPVAFCCAIRLDAMLNYLHASESRAAVHLSDPPPAFPPTLPLRPRSGTLTPARDLVSKMLTPDLLELQHLLTG